MERVKSEEKERKIEVKENLSYLHQYLFREEARSVSG